MESSRQEHWSGLPCPPSGNFPNQGIEPRSPTLQVDSLPSEPPGEAQEYWNGLPYPSIRDLVDPGIEPGPPALQAGSLPAELSGRVKKTPLWSVLTISCNLFNLMAPWA